MKKHVLAIVICCILLAAAVQHIQGFDVTSLDGVAGVLGGAAIFALFALTPPLLLWPVILLTKSQSMRIALPIAAWAIWIATAYFTVSGLSYEHHLVSGQGAILPIKHQFDDCEYAVSFPGPPKISVVHFPTQGRSAQAEYSRAEGKNGAYFRAECVPIPKEHLNFARDRYLLKRSMGQYAEVNGLEKVEIEFPPTTQGMLVTVRGNKYVDDEYITVLVYQFVGQRSYLTLVASGLSFTFPQPGLMEFLNSARRI